MKNKVMYIVLAVFIVLILLSTYIRIALKNDDEISVNLSYAQKEEIIFTSKKRVGLCQSLPDPESTGILYYTLLNLEERGVISGMGSYTYKPFQEDGNNLWNYVCENVKSETLVFVQDFFYDLENDDSDAVMDRLKNHDIDLLFTYGTLAGTKFFNTAHDVMVINYGSNDPVQAGFVKDSDFSGYNNLWAHVDSKRYYNQIKMFHNAVSFKKLGVINYADSFRTIFTPKNDIELLSRELDYDYCIYDFYGVDDIFEVGDRSKYYEELINIYEKAADECDAFYMVIGGWQYEDLQYLLKPFVDKKIPVFSQFGSIEVKNGALMSAGKVDFTDIGNYISSVIIRILSGLKPGLIPQQYNEKVGIAINLSVAKKIGYKPGIQLILNSDEIYK